MQPSIEYLASLLKASWQGAVLILLVLAVQWSFGRRLSPRWRYLLWILVMIRLALPWTIPSSVSLFNQFNFPKSPASDVVRIAPNGPRLAPVQSTAVQTKPAGETVAFRTTTIPQLSLSLWLLRVWAIGASVLTIYLLATHRRLSKRVATFRPLINAPVMTLLEECKQLMGVRVPITLVETTEVGSPALFGFIRPRLLLPVGLTQSFSLDELRYVFLHELSHIKRRDILVGWLMTGLQILHWFNPLVWLAFYRMRVDRELACDALALSYARADENQPYGRTIIKLLESFGRSTWAPSLAGAVENKNQMKERITMIAKFEKTNRGLALAVMLFATLGLVTLTDAQPVGSQLGKDLIGTWVCVGTPGQVGEAPAAGGRLKVVTENQWSLTQTDAKSGATNFHHGGTWTLNGDEYAEAVEYANANTADLVKRTFKFTVKVEGDTLTMIGIGNPWKEVWKRVKSEAIKPLKPDSIQGKWRGKEAGETGTCSLVLQGSTLEFQGADTNEWYKATFSAYDTTPKQLVVFITDCPMPQYVGRTAYAIYQLENGTLTVTGNEPGNPTVPAGFDASGARKLVFKQE
jgi:beta-lactamase regulating signal transducer with metallopeptidase domain